MGLPSRGGLRDRDRELRELESLSELSDESLLSLLLPSRRRSARSRFFMRFSAFFRRHMVMAAAGPGGAHGCPLVDYGSHLAASFYASMQVGVHCYNLEDVEAHDQEVTLLFTIHHAQ